MSSTSTTGRTEEGKKPKGKPNDTSNSASNDHKAKRKGDSTSTSMTSSSSSACGDKPKRKSDNDSQRSKSASTSDANKGELSTPCSSKELGGASGQLEISAFFAKLQEENAKLMTQMFQENMSKFKQELSQAQRHEDPEKDSHRPNPRQDKVSYPDEDILDLHPDSELEDEQAGSSKTLPATYEQDDDVDSSRSRGVSVRSANAAASIAGTTGTQVSKNLQKEIQWTSVMKQLPSYYEDLGLDSQDETPAHTSYLADTFQSSKSPAMPRFPIDGVMKQKWDEIAKYSGIGEVSPYTSTMNRMFMVKESDFEKYGKIPKIDEEYTAMVCAQKPKSKNKFGSNKGRTSEPLIKDKQLRIAESDLQKCDESARVILRAVSHGSLILNAANTVVSNHEQYQPEEALNLIHGAFQALESIADCAVRVTARSIKARRRIYLSQIAFKDPNTQTELMKLPMDGKHLFHGEFSDKMHKFATLARDARETSEAIASPFVPTKRHADAPPKGPALKKQATNKQDGSKVQSLQVTRNANERRRQVSFQRDRGTQEAPRSKPFFPKKGKWGNKQ